MTDGFSGMTSMVVPLSLETSAPFHSLARMTNMVIVIETCLAVDTKMIGSEESRERITSVVVFTHFDEDDLFFLTRNFEEDLVFLMHGKDDDLMVGEMTLKRRVRISF